MHQQSTSHIKINVTHTQNQDQMLKIKVTPKQNPHHTPKKSTLCDVDFEV